jgi:DNA invertase Pin-like site-specific DNA recombinase
MAGDVEEAAHTPVPVARPRCATCMTSAQRSSPTIGSATLRILNFGGDPVDTRGATGRLMLNMFAAMAQFERETMLERQREGIAKAKAEGKYKGRKPTARAKADDAVRMFRDGRRVAHVAKDLGIGRGSVYRALEAAGLTGEIPNDRTTRAS